MIHGQNNRFGTGLTEKCENGAEINYLLSGSLKLNNTTQSAFVYYSVRIFHDHVDKLHNVCSAAPKATLL